MASALQRHNVQMSGRGEQSLLFAHGLGCDQSMWRLVAPAFEDAYRVVLFDHVGAGASDRLAYDSRRHAQLEGYAADVVEICEALALQDAVFIGHSVSAMIGVLAAIMAPQHFERLVLIGPSPRYVNDPPDYVGGFDRASIDGLLDLMANNYAGWAGMLAPAAVRPGDRPAASDASLAASWRASDPQIARAFARVTFLSDTRLDLPKLRRPALVLQCQDDAISPQQVGRYVYSQLQQGSFQLLQASGHYPPLSHPAQTIAAIRNYLQPAQSLA